MQTGRATGEAPDTDPRYTVSLVEAVEAGVERLVLERERLSAPPLGRALAYLQAAAPALQIQAYRLPLAY